MKGVCRSGHEGLCCGYQDVVNKDVMTTADTPATTDTIPQTVLFKDLFDKPLVATFDQQHASADGGAVLLTAAERVYGLVKALARCLVDKRAPVLAFLRFNCEAEQYLCAALLRHGRASASQGAVALRVRLLPLLRCAFPRAHFLVRLDGGFATPEVLDFLDAQPRLVYTVAMANNAVLRRHAEPAMQVVRARSAESGHTEQVYDDTRYQAGKWTHPRRVVIKAEVVRLGDREPRDNPRFVVTNLRATPQYLYEKVYCARGDVENRIKELLDGMQIDRTSCHQFLAHQMRRPADRRCLCAPAGTAPARRPHGLAPEPR